MHDHGFGQFIADLEKLVIFFGTLGLYFHWICNILRRSCGLDHQFLRRQERHV